MDKYWRPPRGPGQAMDHPWQLAEVVNEVASIHEVGVADLLAGIVSEPTPAHKPDQ